MNAATANAVEAVNAVASATPASVLNQPIQAMTLLAASVIGNRFVVTVQAPSGKFFQGVVGNWEEVTGVPKA